MSYRSDSDGNFFTKLFIASLAFIVYLWYVLLSGGQSDKLWLVASQNFPWYITTVAVIGFGCWWWWKNEEFSNGELILYVIVALFAVYPSIALGYLYATDLHDVEIWNGTATSADWEESYYTESTDKDGKKSTTYHSASYTLHTSNGHESVTLTKDQWLRYVAHWGGYGRVTSRRNLTADGETWFDSNHDGIAEILTISWDGKEESRIPTSVEHTYANFLKASDSVQKVQGVASRYSQWLRQYPRVSSGAYGEIVFDHVINSGAAVPGDFRDQVNEKLNRALSTLGAKCQCNVVVYLVGSDDPAIFSGLQDYWIRGKKNDVVAVIGYTGGQVRWARTMAWTKHALFIEKMERELRDFGPLEGRGAELADGILQRITARGDEGYLRTPMAELSYLASEVSMPLWAEILIMLFGCLVMLPTILWAINND